MKKPCSEIRRHKQALCSVYFCCGCAHTKTHAFAFIMPHRRFLPNLTSHILQKEKQIRKEKKIFRMFCKKRNKLAKRKRYSFNIFLLLTLYCPGKGDINLFFYRRNMILILSIRLKLISELISIICKL